MPGCCFFYTTFVGLSPIESASIVAIARIVDAIVSLFMGSFTDHFYKNYLGKKFGRRRFFLLIGAPLMLVYALLWLDGMSYGFYLAVYLAFENYCRHGLNSLGNPAFGNDQRF
nr:putative oligogalacturonide transporter [Raoultella sp. NCTC 9187]